MPTVKRQLPTPPTARKVGSTPTPTSRSSASAELLERIKPIGFDADEGIKINIYGRSGSGKTTTWSTFPKPILALICSGGSNPGELRSIDTPENRESISALVLEHSTDVSKAVEAVRSGAAEYATVVLDHATGLQDLVLKEILGWDQLPAQRSWGMATQQQYGQCTLQCKELFRELLSLSQNVVIIAQEREFNTDAGSELLAPAVGSGLTPSLTGWLNTAVDYICQTFIREQEEVKETTVGTGPTAKVIPTRRKTGRVEYCLRTAPHPVYTTKFRVPRGADLPEVITDPSYEKIYALIRGRLQNR